MQVVKTKIFEYGDEEINYLKSVDRLLGEIIDRMGKIESIVIPDIFQALVYAIIGQQISTKATRTIWAKLMEKSSGITPEAIAALQVDDIHHCGMSANKAKYIKELADLVLRKEIDLEALRELPDKELIKRLSSLKGISVRSAELLLMNCFERKNVLCYGDIAIRRGLMKLYSLNELPKEQFVVYKNRYSPYASVASLYLWKLSYE